MKRLRRSEVVCAFLVVCLGVWLVNSSIEPYHSSSSHIFGVKTRTREKTLQWNAEEEEATNNRLFRLFRAKAKPQQHTREATTKRRFRRSKPEAQQHEQLTRMGTLAKAFESVLTKRGPRMFCEIDTHQLLQACRKLEASMRSIGQSQAAKEMENNICKVEALYKQTTDKQRRTLTHLLEYEKSLGIHEPGGLLKDPSAAIGLLWIRRSLSFQYKMYSILLTEKKTPTEAALDAYNTELRPFHAWPLQRLYTLALKTGSPSQSRDIMARLGGYNKDDITWSQEQATRRDLQQLLRIWRPLLSRWKQIYHDLDLEDTRRV